MKEISEQRKQALTTAKLYAQFKRDLAEVSEDEEFAMIVKLWVLSVLKESSVEVFLQNWSNANIFRQSQTVKAVPTFSSNPKLWK